MIHRVVCTAGHIDHGKTSLIKAITGTDTDRLQEEKLRGITIDLGFGFYDDKTTVIDLPGHEKFIRNMVAGAATVDMAILVIAADDGPMPQTYEHLDILNLLGIQTGLIALTKIDLVDKDWIELVSEDIREKVSGTFLADTPIIPLDSVSGKGIEDFRLTFNKILDSLPVRISRPEYRQPVDRSFTIKGFGTVVTGTVISGEVNLKDTIELLPAGKLLKVRGIQVQEKDCKSASAGFRAALNLSGVEKYEVTRGDMLAKPGFLKPAAIFDCRITLLSSSSPLKHRQRLRFHIGTAEIIGRILLLEDNILKPGEESFAQLELENPAMVLRGDRFVFRTYSPQITIGGGEILMPAEEKHKRRQQRLLQMLSSLASGKSETIITSLLKNAGWSGLQENTIIYKSSISEKDFKIAIDNLLHTQEIVSKKSGGDYWYAFSENLEELRDIIISIISDFHKSYPAQPGITLAQLKSRIKTDPESPFIEFTVESLVNRSELSRRGSLFSLPDYKITLTPLQKELTSSIMQMISEAGLSALKAHPVADKLGIDVDQVKDLLAVMESIGNIVRLETETVMSRELYEDTIDNLKNLEKQQGVIRLNEVMQNLGISRRVAVTFLEYTDRNGITERNGDERKFKT